MFGAILAAATLMTTWGEKVTPENAWREYPRPQMVRANWTNLNGQWDYAVTSVTNTPGRPTTWEGKILVPFAIESKLSGVERLIQPDEFLWYTRTIECDPKPGERILLHFGGVVKAHVAWEYIVLRRNKEHRVKLQTLCGVHCHKRNAVGLRIVVIHIAYQRYLLKEIRKRCVRLLVQH